MQPQKLVMTAFGPYAQKEVIDFTKLGPHRFFLITGPTGSGKTTILDAITFALYGTPSGDLRDTRSLRSDYASPEEKTEVQFIFTHLGKTYEVIRTPEQTLRKQRGEGMRNVPVGASLVEIQPDGQRSLLATTSNTTTKAVEQLLGFQAVQFRQLMVLPQGEFRRFLVADSKERKEILETLFKTAQYRELEEILDKKAKELKKQYEQQKERHFLLLETAGVKTADALKEKITSQQQEKNSLSKKIQVARASWQEAQDTLHRAQELKTAWQQLEENKEEEKKLARQEPEMAELQQRLRQLDEAQKLHTPYEQAKKSYQQLNTAKARLAASQKAQEVAEKDLQEKLAVATQQSTQALQEHITRMREKLAQVTAVSGETVRLAQTLQEGIPCPVCGALHHPRPATETQKERERLKAQTSLLEQQVQQLQKQQQALEAAQKEAERARIACKEIAISLATAQSDFEEDKAAYQAALASSLFTDQASFLAAHKCLAKRTLWQAQLETYKKEKSSLQGKTNFLLTQIKKRPCPAILSLAEKVNKQREALETLTGQWGALQKTLEQNEKAAHQAGQLEKELAKLQNLYGPLGLLAETAKGTNTRKLTFSSFVLQAVLDDVLQAANQRLSKISEGRYTLLRSEKILDARKEQGLNLAVLDAFTGQERSVATLSGGEIFFTSLSLALGLSDVLESYAGGLHLDTILVDEGFGSLDPETLDAAINTLLALQEGGRLVGIISHVAELKERIPAQLEIIPTQQGSRTHFKV